MHAICRVVCAPSGDPVFGNCKANAAAVVSRHLRRKKFYIKYSKPGNLYQVLEQEGLNGTHRLIEHHIVSVIRIANLQCKF